MGQKVFIGYSQKPKEVGDEVRLAASITKRSGLVDVNTWEETPTSGRLIITTVLQVIDESAMCLFDITTLSENVLFEVGYAFSRQKRLMLSVNTNYEAARYNWKSLNIFATAGCLFYQTAGELARNFMTCLSEGDQRTLWHDVSEGLGAYRDNSLFFVPTYQASEAERNLRRVVSSQGGRGTHITLADPGEQGSAPLAWYVNAVYSSSATLLQFAGDRNHRSVVNNARTAFLAGLSKGLGRPLLIVVDDNYHGPVDYRDLVYVYQNKRRLKERVRAWLDEALLSGVVNRGAIQPTSPKLELATELKDLKFGEYVAEDESETLDEYFVRTAEYDAVLSSSSVVFVGRKGVGKSANMIRASQELAEDKRNLICVIRPAAYELEGLVSVLESLGLDGNQAFLVESFWKFLLYSEMAITAVSASENLPAGIGAGTPMAELRSFLEANDLTDEFSIRLEKVIEDAREKIGENGAQQKMSIEKQRERIGQVLQSRTVSNLRRLLGNALGDRARVAILVDHLDTAWRKTARLRPLAILLLGLLGSSGRIAEEFKRERNGLNKVNVTLAVFLRADIFDEVIKEAREPDKINTMRIDWSQRDLLTRVMDERYLAVRPDDTDPNELWSRFFCPTVNGIATRDYIFSRILSRPRDFVFLCKAAVFNAVNARHDRVESRDILEAEKSYSQFALDALIVEYGSTREYMEDVLFEFAGSQSIVTRSAAIETIARSIAGSGDHSAEIVLEELIRISFFGIEVREDEFRYPDSDADIRKAKVLSRKAAAEMKREERLEIHPAYRIFLDINEIENA